MKGNKLMRKFIGDIFDDVGSFFARNYLDRAAFCFYNMAEWIDPNRLEEQ